MIGLEKKLDYLITQVDQISARQTAIEDFIGEMQPIVDAMMGAGISTFGDLEKKGYFTFFKESLHVLDQVVTGYDAEEVRMFGDHIVSILDTVRNLTQPDVLDIANEGIDALHDAGDAEPVSVWGMYKATKDEDVRKGMAVMFEVIRQVGKSAAKLKKGGKKKEAPKRRGAPKRLSAPTRTPRKVAKSVAKPIQPVGGIALPGQDGFVEDWNVDYAKQAAAVFGIEFTDEHLPVVTWARQAYIDSGSAPNVRAITQGSGCDTRSLYRLFPKGPGKKVAAMAGIPKPGGCI